MASCRAGTCEMSRKQRGHTSTLVVAGCVLSAVVSTHWVRLNLSPSVPYGLYRVHAITSPLRRGTLVVLATPPRMRPWHAASVPLLKPVAGVAGDTVCIRDEGLWINEQWYGAVHMEAHGTPLPRLRGCQQISEEEVFLASTAPRSLDSRYFGPVAITTLHAITTPLMTWE